MTYLSPHLLVPMAQRMIMAFCCAALLITGCSSRSFCSSDLQKLKELASIYKGTFYTNLRTLNHSDCGYLYNIRLESKDLQTQKICDRAEKDLRTSADEYYKFADEVEIFGKRHFCDNWVNAQSEYHDFEYKVILSRRDISSANLRHFEKKQEQFRFSDQ